MPGPGSGIPEHIFKGRALRDEATGYAKRLWEMASSQAIYRVMYNDDREAIQAGAMALQMLAVRTESVLDHESRDFSFYVHEVERRIDQWISTPDPDHQRNIRALAGVVESAAKAVVVCPEEREPMELSALLMSNLSLLTSWLALGDSTAMTLAYHLALCRLEDLKIYLDESA